MRPERGVRILIAVLALSVTGPACSDGRAHGAANDQALRGPVTVFAAASLTEAFTDEKAVLARRAPGLRLTYTFAGSQALATQIAQGAPADVFASADAKNMQKLVDAGAVETPHVFARNSLEIAVRRGNPKHVTGLADLARPDLTVVLADPAVPIGAYSRQVLRTAGVTVAAKSRELDVKAALSKVTLGEADATIVYASDVKAAGTRAEGVIIPRSTNIVATYPIAVLSSSHHRAAARAFVAEIVSGTGQRALVARGFLPVG